MKYFLYVILILSFASPSVAMQDKEVSIGEISKQAMSAFRAGEYASTIPLLDRLVELGVKNANVWTLKGQCLSKLGKFQEAVGCFDKAIEVDDKFVDAIDERMHHYYFKLNDPQKALADCDRLFELGEKYHFMRARISDKLEMRGQAIADYSATIKESLGRGLTEESRATVAQAYYYRGVLFQLLEAYDLANEDGKRSREIMPSARSLKLIGRNSDIIGDFDQAIDCLSQLLEKDPDVFWYLKRAESYAGAGQFEKAEADLQVAEKAAGENASFLSKIKESKEWIATYRNGGDPRKDASENEKEYGGPTEVLAMAKLMDSNGLSEKALALLSKLHNFSQHNRAEVTYLRADQLFNLKAFDLALEEFEKAIELGHTGPGTRIAVGILHMGADQFQKAIEDYEYEVSVDPSNPGNWLQLGIGHSCLGNLAKARKQFETMAEKSVAGSQMRLIADNSLKSIENELAVLGNLTGASAATGETILQHFSPDYESVLEPSKLSQSLRLITKKVDFNRLNWMDRETTEVGNRGSKMTFSIEKGKTLQVYIDENEKLVGVSVDENGVQWNTFSAARGIELTKEMPQLFWPALLSGDLERAHELFVDGKPRLFPFEKFKEVFGPVIKEIGRPLKSIRTDCIRVLPDEESPTIRAYYVMETEGVLPVPATMTFTLFEGKFRFSQFQLCDVPDEFYRNDIEQAEAALRSFLDIGSQGIFGSFDPGSAPVDYTELLPIYQKAMLQQLGTFVKIDAGSFSERVSFENDSQHNRVNGKLQTTNGEVGFRIEFLDGKIERLNLEPNQKVEWIGEVEKFDRYENLGEKFLFALINGTIDDARDASGFSEQELSTERMLKVQKETVQDLKKVNGVSVDRHEYFADRDRWRIHYLLESENGKCTASVDFIFYPGKSRLISWIVESPQKPEENSQE